MGACLVLPPAQAAGRREEHIHFQKVVDKAKALAEQPFEEPEDVLPESLKKIGFDQWRDIRFKPSRGLWGNEPFSVQFFHPGFIYIQPVTINAVSRTLSQKIAFSPDLFTYAKDDYGSSLKTDIGFAGFRVHYPLNRPDYADELVSFLGASYFRALGKNLLYGLSARGLAIDTAENTGEEFPLFKEFWIVHPVAAAKSITLYALLDSPSITGGYEFVIYPGEETKMSIKCTLFVRKRVRKLGIAPLTSMFYYGENSRPESFNDFRPEVHDSDGFLTQTQSGEWIWHPLIDPERLLINAFGGGQPRGFGLLQRDTDFDHYQDLEARYELRPSAWMEPQGNWGPGHMELLQIPTDNEYNDNIVAYWVPETPLDAGESVSYAYTLSWFSAQHKRSPLASVEATRVVKKTDEITFIVEFQADPSQSALLTKELAADIQILNDYKMSGSQIIPNPVTGGWRLIIHVKLDKATLLEQFLPNPPPALELRAFLKDHDLAVTETWSYTYLPEDR